MQPVHGFHIHIQGTKRGMTVASLIEAREKPGGVRNQQEEEKGQLSFSSMCSKQKKRKWKKSLKSQGEKN